ncbi:MAG: hypothetical protein MJA29_09205 [Candidatus Omnitrophica bacterium]|nr:hypothetical protein [Candidatus Omnitrophota bacterium]
MEAQHHSGADHAFVLPPEPYPICACSIPLVSMTERTCGAVWLACTTPASSPMFEDAGCVQRIAVVSSRSRCGLWRSKEPRMPLAFSR